MPENWKTYKLGEIAKVQTGPFGSQLHQKDYVENGTPLVTVKNLGARKINRDNLDGVSDEDISRLQKYIMRKGDILFSRVGANIDRTSLVTEEEAGWMFSSSTLMARVKHLNVISEYLIYHFHTPIFKNLMRTIAVGATRPSLNSGILRGIEIILPPLLEQRAIANILSALDDKIENNLAMNKTLEAMAMALYKHWFVDFRPFQDGEFIDSELGLIPEGWEVKKLNEYWKSSQYGYTESSSSDVVGPKFLRITDIQGGIVEWDKVPYCPIDDKNFEKYQITKGDLFVARTGNSTGENTYVLNAPDSVFASYLIRFQFDALEQSCYVAKTFRSKRFFDFIDGAKAGSAQPGISASALGSFDLISPPEDVLAQFYNQVNSTDEQREQNLVENQTLINLRDTLLPKLISGEVHVNDIEKTVSEVL